MGEPDRDWDGVEDSLEFGRPLLQGQFGPPSLRDVGQRADAADGNAGSIEVDPSGSLDPTFGAVASSDDAELGPVRPTAQGLVRRAVLLRDPIPVLGMYQRGEQGRIGKAISR